MTNQPDITLSDLFEFHGALSLFLGTWTHKVVTTNLSGFVLTQTHRVLLVYVASTTWVEMCHRQPSLVNDNLYVAFDLLRHASGARRRTTLVNRSELGIAWAPRLHVRRLDRRVVAMEATKPGCRAIVSLVNCNGSLFRVHFLMLLSETDCVAGTVVARCHHLLAVTIALALVIGVLIRQQILGLRADMLYAAIEVV